MLKRIVMTLPAMALLTAAGAGFAQNPEPPRNAEPQKFYKLDFVLKEVEGSRVLNSRSYSTTVANEKETASVRAGSRVPVPTSPGDSQFTYIDVGVNIDCRNVKDLGRDLSLFVTADISSTPQPEPGAPATPAPIVRQNKWSSPVIVPLKKATLIFSSDDLTSKRQMQLELTAAPIR